MTVGFVLVGASLGMLLHGRTDSGAEITRARAQLHDTSDGRMRVMMNTTMHYEKGRIQDVFFQSVNENRYMKCRIRLDGAGKGDYVAETPFLSPGEMVRSLSADRFALKRGTNRGTAEICTYSSRREETQIGQAEVELQIEKGY